MAPKKVIYEIIFCILWITIASVAQAEVKHFGSLQFQLPDKWSCQINGQSMICLDGSPNAERNAAIVVTFKTASAEDSLTVYRDQLARPRILYNGEISQPSIPKSVKDISINDQIWVEGIHYGSEMANYITQYYASIFNKTAFLVSLSIDSSVHSKVIESFVPTILSFKFTADKSTESAKLKNSTIKNTNNNLQNNSQNQQQNSLKTAKTVTILGYNIHIYYLLIAAAAIVLIGLAVYAVLMD